MSVPQHASVALLPLILAAQAFPAAGGTAVPLAPGEYELTAETVLPHLEEALRYATTRTRHCLRAPDATGMFPLLRHQAFTGCKLVGDGEAGGGLHFSLHCANPQAASGSAAFQVEAERINAILEIKMGGKNMTLSQRLHGPRIGACADPGAR